VTGHSAIGGGRSLLPAVRKDHLPPLIDPAALRSRLPTGPSAGLAPVAVVPGNAEPPAPAGGTGGASG